MLGIAFAAVTQRRHDRDSVRPISAIEVDDYEDLLAVRISNVGIGPLTIKEILFTAPGQKGAILVNMMPQIDQMWDTFTKDVTGWTIPVGGHVSLLQLTPLRADTRQSVRRALAPVTVFIKYTDIYRTPFTYSRDLSFFARTISSESPLSLSPRLPHSD